MQYHQAMNQYFRPLTIVIGTAVLLAGQIVLAQSKVVKTVPAQTTNAWNGDDLYKEFCAVCHGTDGRGGGPAASALKTAPSDLTQFAKQHGGKFTIGREVC